MVIAVIAAHPDPAFQDQNRVWTADELKSYSGHLRDRNILVSFKGVVYDVSSAHRQVKLCFETGQASCRWGAPTQVSVSL